MSRFEFPLPLNGRSTASMTGPPDLDRFSLVEVGIARCHLVNQFPNTDPVLAQ
jgi:hypothetical protein